MVTIDGYSIEQYPKNNVIVVVLPQTAETATNTFFPIVERKQKLTDEEMGAVLAMVIGMLKTKRGENDEID